MKATGNSGFTLIETVISLVLLSFIAIIGYQGLIFGMNQWRKGHDNMQFQYDYHQAIGWVRNKLSSAEKVLQLRGNRQAYLFVGDAQSVEFVARFDRARRGGLYVSKLDYDAASESIYVSYYLRHPEIDGDQDSDSSERVPLLSNIASVRISYYGRKLGGRTDWHDSWRDSNTLPRLIRLEIKSVEGVNYQSTINVLTSNNV